MASARIGRNLQIPTQLAVKFGRAAVAGGLTGGQALGMLNDQRFAAAVGSPDQGYGLLEAMIQHPSYIQKGYVLLADRHYTASGADSLQTAIMSVVPELRNAYLKDLGLMAVDNGSGILVLVDIETGRQYIGQGMLGAQLRGPRWGTHPIALHLPGGGGRPDVDRGRPSRSPEPGPRGALGAREAARADLSGAVPCGSALPLCLGRLRCGRGGPASGLARTVSGYWLASAVADPASDRTAMNGTGPRRSGGRSSFEQTPTTSRSS